MRRQAPLFFLQIGELLLELAEPIDRRLVLFLAQRFALDFQLHDAPLDLVELDRHRVDLHPQLRCRFIHQVDGLVRQEAVGDVAVREHRRGDERGVLDPHLVMDLVALAQPAEDADGVFHARFGHHDRLEPAFQGGVLFDVLPVLVERGRADGMKLAARQHRLQHVRRVHRAFGGAGADDGVELVDEQDHLALGVENFLEHGLQALFELAAVFGAGDQRAHVEGDDLLALQSLRHVAADDAAGQSFDNRRLADARFADQDRIVLGPPRQHLDDAADLLVAADHRIELAAAGELGEIAAVALERLIGTFRILIGDALGSADGLQGLGDPIRRDAEVLEKLRRRRSACFGGDRHEQMLGADVLVLHPIGFGLGLVRHELQPRRHPGLRSAVGLRELREQLAGAAADRAGIGRQLAQELGNDPLALLDQGDEQVLGLDLRVIHRRGQLLRAGESVAGFFSELVDVHYQLSALGSRLSADSCELTASRAHCKNRCRAGLQACQTRRTFKVRTTFCNTLYATDPVSNFLSASKISRCSGVNCFGSSASTVT